MKAFPFVSYRVKFSNDLSEKVKTINNIQLKFHIIFQELLKIKGLHGDFVFGEMYDQK